MNKNIIKVSTNKSVSAAVDALESLVLKNGAKVFARVNHGAGARSIDAEIGDSELLIFGNPVLGTPAMLDDRLAGLFLPLKILACTDGNGDTWLAYEDPAATVNGLSISSTAEYVEKMQRTLEKLAAAAAA